MDLHEKSHSDLKRHVSALDFSLCVYSSRLFFSVSWSWTAWRVCWTRPRERTSSWVKTSPACPLSCTTHRWGAPWLLNAVMHEARFLNSVLLPPTLSGAAVRGDASEAESVWASASDGGRQEQPHGAAGGGDWGQTGRGEAGVQPQHAGQLCSGSPKQSFQRPTGIFPNA